jgi:hypothetical protein
MHWILIALNAMNLSPNGTISTTDLINTLTNSPNPKIEPPLYFDICSLSYNLFVLMRQILPLEFANKRAKYVRNRLYAIAAKVLQHGRQADK